MDFKNLDKKAKIEIVFTSLMVIVFILILANSAKTIFKSKKSANKSSYLSADAFKEMIKKDVMGTKNIGADESQDIYIDIKREENARPWGRDPFSKKAALSDGDESISDLKLEGILSQHGQSPKAIINGEILGIDDEVGGATIVEVSQDAVVVTDGEKNYKLHLW